MQPLLIASILFFLSSAYVLFLNYLAISALTMQRTIVMPLFVILLLLFYASKLKWKTMLSSRTTWLLLFLCTIITQLIVLSTGGMSSPFLILIHLIMIGIGFIFSFSISLLFLVFSFAVLLIDLWFYQDLFLQTLQSPTQLILQIASLIPIIPISYIISEHYHFKERLSKQLHSQVVTDEAILQSINELIIITDKQFKILSVNDSVERTLRQSRLELLDQPIFQVILLRDSKGVLATAKTFFPDDNIASQPQSTQEQFTFVRSPFTKRSVTVQVQQGKDAENSVNQLTFIISFNADSVSSENLKDTLEKTQTKYEALAESIKKKLNEKQLNELQTEMTLLSRMENDMYHVQTIEQFIDPQTATSIDVAQLCKQIIRLQQPLAKNMRVTLNFELKNFGEKDVAPLTVENFPIKPDQMTGPFFTISSNVTYLELIVKNLLDITLLLAAKQKDATVLLSLERQVKDMILLQVQASSPKLNDDEIKNLLAPNNNILYKEPVYDVASGLEGYLLQKACAALNISLDTRFNPESETITFFLLLPKSVKS